MARELRRGGFSPKWERVETATALREALSKRDWDVVLADYSLPHFTGVEALALIKDEMGLDIPFILVSGVIGEDTAVAAMRAGAQDYILKGHLARLVPAVERELREVEMQRERKRAEEALHLNTAALESAANGIVITDREGTITWVNPAFTELTGYTAEEAVGNNPRLLKSGKQDQPFYQNLWDTILAGKAWSGQLINRRKDGSLYAEEQTITPVRDAEGRIAHFIAIKQNISERKRAEEELRESEERYRSTLDGMIEGCVIVGFDWRFLYVNAAAPGREHRSEKARPGNTVMEAYPGIEGTEWFTYARRCMEERIPHRMESETTFPDGTKLWFDSRVQPVPEGILVASLDITERKRAEEALERSRDELEGKVEHQLLRRNPYGLTFRELTVLNLVAAGGSDRQIALVLSISHLTVQKHVSNILEKMQVASRTEASVRAVREGMLE
jgi:PAS domain S-box-containing protein